MEGLLTIPYSAGENWLLFLILIQPLFLLIQLAWSYSRLETMAHIPIAVKYIRIYHLLLFAYLCQLVCMVAAVFYFGVDADYLGYAYFSYWAVWLYYLLGISMKLCNMKQSETQNN